MNRYPRKLASCRIVSLRAIWPQKLKGKLAAIAIAAIASLIHVWDIPWHFSKATLLFWGLFRHFNHFSTPDLCQRFIPTSLQVFWKHKQKRKDVIPIVLSLEMPGNYGPGESHGYQSSQHVFNRETLRFDMMFCVFQMHGAGAIGTDTVASHEKMVHPFNLPSRFVLGLIYTNKTLATVEEPFNSDSSQRACRGVQSVVHISLDVLKTPDKAGRQQID